MNNIDKFISENLDKFHTLEQAIKSDIVGNRGIIIDFYDEEDESRKLVMFDRESNILKNYFYAKVIIATIVVFKKDNEYDTNPYILIKSENYEPSSLFDTKRGIVVRTPNDKGAEIEYLIPKHDTYSPLYKMTLRELFYFLGPDVHVKITKSDFECNDTVYYLTNELTSSLLDMPIQYINVSICESDGSRYPLVSIKMKEELRKCEVIDNE